MRQYINLAVFFMFTLFSANSLATSVFFSNRTDQPIKIMFSYESNRIINEGNQFNTHSYDVQPYSRILIAEFNRYYGLKTGGIYNYYFEISRQNESGEWTVDQDEPKPHLQIVGNPTGSSIEYGFKNQTMINNYQAYVIHDYGIDGDHNQYGVKALYTSNFYDVEFVIADHYVNDSEVKNTTLSIASYNLWMIPAVSSDIEARVSHLPHNLSGYDVLALQEAFSGSRENLFDELEMEYFHSSGVIHGDNINLYDGGIVTLSHYPILESDSVVFESCSGTDCYADKGVVYTKINKNGEIYHVFNTHLASFSTNSAKRLRRIQLILMRAFMLTKNIPDDEAVIYIGDFNIDKNGSPLEYQMMLRVLEVDEPYYLGYIGATFEPGINQYAGQRFSGGATSEYLDYVFVSARHRKLIRNTNTVSLVQYVDNEIWGKWHLSDHFSVSGLLDF
ncbi:metal-dependent hydrolase [Shewanella psychrophila]|uniref:Metal-dependent hydrolase n=1 Tax=Shewanella psychrophila TaxID=225848 RepID=A0A1S6HSQ2_9GAMM|nr:sphingomyelin phosphodiesterase [Shewanella psychrophila]AQS38539.1 metal-dependent hydrolase [Shewanella psychrophila]